jgi:GMP synthase-like glutamine amidotransferase
MRRATIALFIHQPKCSVQSANGIMRALGQHYNFKIFTRHELEKDFFDDVDLVAVPGGVGEADSYDYLMRVHQQAIRNYIASGKHYLGICMGAYWADTDYFGLLNNVRVQQYIRHPSSCTRRPHAKEMPVTWQGVRTSMYFYDGCTYYGSGFETVATYPNGAPMAIIQDRVGLIGCHPEAQSHWYQDYSWMRKLDPEPKHSYLLDFVDNLMNR